MVITITINTDNAAFEGNPAPEVARILHTLAQDIDAQDDAVLRRRLRDLNGNTVGAYTVDVPEED